MIFYMPVYKGSSLLYGHPAPLALAPKQWTPGPLVSLLARRLLLALTVAMGVSALAPVMIGVSMPPFDTTTALSPLMRMETPRVLVVIVTPWRPVLEGAAVTRRLATVRTREVPAVSNTSIDTACGVGTELWWKMPAPVKKGGGPF